MFSYRALESDYGNFRFFNIICLQNISQEDLTKHCMIFVNDREVNEMD